MAGEKKPERRFNALLNTETGEIMNTSVGYWRWRPRLDWDSKENGVRYVGGGYCKVQNTALPLLAREDLSRDAWRVLFLMLGRLNRRNEVVCGRKTPRAAFLARKLGLAAGSVENILYRLRDAGLVAYRGGADGFLYVNPFAFQVGVRHDKALIEAFRDTRYFEAWTSELKRGLPDWY